ncbi:hypothetical protein KC337_g28 [Hortaea werneckii]|nr:hypothetical protein KC337_g28 [Hortaea werneckii]
MNFRSCHLLSTEYGTDHHFGNASLEVQSGSRSAEAFYVGTSELMLSCKRMAPTFHLPEDPGNRYRLVKPIHVPGSDRVDGILGCLPSWADLDVYKSMPDIHSMITEPLPSHLKERFHLDTPIDS